jgi:hypothetical protein
VSRIIAAILPPGVLVMLEQGKVLETCQQYPALIEWDGEHAKARVRIGGGEDRKGAEYFIEHEELARHSEWFATAREDARKAMRS